MFACIKFNVVFGYLTTTSVHVSWLSCTSTPDNILRILGHWLKTICASHNVKCQSSQWIIDRQSGSNVRPNAFTISLDAAQPTVPRCLIRLFTVRFLCVEGSVKQYDVISKHMQIFSKLELLLEQQLNYFPVVIHTNKIRTYTIDNRNFFIDVNYIVSCQTTHHS